MTVLIKRYANRKLYNTAISRYITLKGIAELIEQGEEVRVIDNETGEDITSIALSQILVDNERGGRAMPRSLLSNLIQRSGDALYSALKRSVDDASGGIGEIQRNVRRAIHSHEEDAKRLRNAWSGARTELEELIQGAVERVFGALDLPRRSDIEVLNANLERVADALEGLGRPAGDGDAAAAEAASEETQPPEG
jgi:polyhydroxyalkanoate synthesis repressor PhaR